MLSLAMIQALMSQMKKLMNQEIGAAKNNLRQSSVTEKSPGRIPYQQNLPVELGYSKTSQQRSVTAKSPGRAQLEQNLPAATAKPLGNCAILP